jgi:hypothetical protein
MDANGNPIGGATAPAPPPPPGPLPGAAHAAPGPVPVVPAVPVVPTAPAAPVFPFPPVHTMPAPGQNTAPKFDDSQPRELRRYFAELDKLFRTCGIVADAEKKEQACRYLKVHVAELWESTPQYGPAFTYDEFVDMAYQMYPGSDDKRKWSIADMDQLVGERQRLGMYSLADLGNYYRSFFVITSFLMSKNRLSAPEQSRAFLRGFQPDLKNRIAHRLELKHPDHHPDDPYDLKDIHEAAKFVLHGSGPSAFQARIASSNDTATTPSPPIVKAEDFTTMFEAFAQTLVKHLAPRTTGSASSSSSPSHNTESNDGRCNFCGGLGHFMPACELLAKYIVDGKCKRNAEGKVVLPSGAFAARTLGRWLMERIDEWHRRNPGQLAAAQISSNTTMMYGIASPVPTILTSRSSDTPHSSFQLTTADRIASLEKELFTLRSGKRFDGVEVPRLRRNNPPPAPRNPVAPANKEQTAPTVERQSEPVKDSVPASSDTSAKPAPPSNSGIPAIPAPSSTSAPNTNSTVPDPSDSPVHPFANVKETNYLPPHERNFAAPAPKPPKEKDFAYRTQAPVQDPRIAEEVYARTLKAPLVTLSSQELWALSPEVRQKVRDTVTPKRVSNDAKDVLINSETTKPYSDDELPYATNAAFSTPPPGALVIPDPYESYLTSLRPGDRPEVLTVAKESYALRSIHMLVDNQETIKSIVDPGSQIIAMSEDVAHQLGLIYDPTIRLNLQSANGEIDQSLGLARNVPCNIGGTITLYLQIHVIREPAYDILLGRPFDVLTESVVKNFANADQTITIHDPNSGRRATIPTLPRSPARGSSTRSAARAPDFQTSMVSVTENSP